MVPVVITSLDNDIYVYTDVADFIGATIVAFLVVLFPLYVRRTGLVQLILLIF